MEEKGMNFVGKWRSYKYLDTNEELQVSALAEKMGMGQF